MLCSNLQEVNRKYKLYGNKILTLCRLYKGRTKPADPSNYRPISLLSVFTKIFEKEKKNRCIMAFLETNSVLCDSQYVFRKIIPLNTH